MSIGWVDFLIGLFLANAIPHLVVGRMDIRFFAVVGYSAKANIGYSIWNVLLAAAISIYAYGFAAFWGNTLFWGFLTLYVIYAISGRWFYLKFKLDS